LRVLLDTNIFIFRENDHVVPKNLQNLLVAMSEAGAKILVHPKSTEDLRRDHNSERREVIMSKIGSYSLLESPPDPSNDEAFLRRVGNLSDENDRVDAAILYSVYRDAVTYLITEDKDNQKRSDRIGLRNRILSIDQGLAVFQGFKNRKGLPYPPALSKVPVYDLDLADPFFEPLKREYSEFNSWFKRISQEGRNCLAYFNEDRSLGALMIQKFEDGIVDSNPPQAAKKRMKIATLKVDHTGYKIGELFVKLAVHDAIANNCEEVYLTHFLREKDSLVELIQEYGFESVAVNARGEKIFVKELQPDREKLTRLHPVEVAQKFYPIFCDGRMVKKFLVPIRPEYHERLFIDYAVRQTTLPEYRGRFIIEGNAIKKAYLCNSNNRVISRGDIMLFYRSGDRQEVTSLGVVERVHVNLRAVEEVSRLVEKRTVYSINEIRDMLEKPTVVFLFTWHFYLPRPISLAELQRMGISAPQTLTRVSHARYLEIKRRGGIDEHFTFN